MRDDALDARLASRLAQLRAERGWSLDDLAERAGISRSSLSRIERSEISPTAALLGRLCTAYERTMSQLLAEVESEPPQLVSASAQFTWHDEASGFTRRTVSPPRAGLRGEVIEGTLDPGADIRYDAPPLPGLEHHLWLFDGTVRLTVDGHPHHLAPGDCLRYRLWGASHFHNPGPAPARYAVLLVHP